MKKMLGMAAVALAVFTLAGCCCSPSKAECREAKQACVCQCCKGGKCCCKAGKCGASDSGCCTGEAKKEYPKK